MFSSCTIVLTCFSLHAFLFFCFLFVFVCLFSVCMFVFDFKQMAEGKRNTHKTECELIYFASTHIRVTETDFNAHTPKSKSLCLAMKGWNSKRSVCRTLYRLKLKRIIKIVCEDSWLTWRECWYGWPRRLLDVDLTCRKYVMRMYTVEAFCDWICDESHLYWSAWLNCRKANKWPAK